MDEIIGACVSCTIEGSATEPSVPKTFHSVAYTGGILSTGAYPKGIVIDLAGMQSVKRIVANLDHNKTSRVGHITAIKNDGRTLEIDGSLSAATPAREEVIASARDGFEWQTSVEVRPISVEHIAAGKSVEVNGQTVRGPMPIARKSSLYGLAFVGQGADENTSAKIAASAENNFKKDKTMNELEKWIEANGFDHSALNDAQKASLKKSYDAEIKAVADDQDHKPIIAKFDIDELKAAYAGFESKIEAAMFKAVGQVGAVELSAIKAAALSSAVALKSKAIENEWSALQFNVEAIQSLSDVQVKLIRAERPQGPAIHASTHDMSNKVIEAALCQTVGLPDIEKSYDDKTLQSAHTAFHGRIGLQQLVIMAAASNGLHFAPGQQVNSGNLREVLAYAFPSIHAAGVSTLSLSGILGNVANKELLVGYMEEDQTWREISRIASVNDFKQNRSYRLLDSMEYEELAPDGTIRHAKTGEEFYTREADTYAKMFAITRKDIINDDLSAFDDVRSRLGRGAAQKFNNLFWAKFINNSSFFTSGRANYITGATTTLLTDGVGIALGIKAFRTLKSPTADGAKRLGGNPSILLVPPELEGAGDKLFMGEKLNVGSGPGEENVYRNKYRPICVPWLSDSAFTGFSATAWYLLRNPANLAAMAVSFLNGNQTPIVESAEADFNTLGIQFRGYHDFGCDQAEYLAGIKSKGAA